MKKILAAIGILVLTACSQSDLYTPPDLKQGVVEWIIVDRDKVPKLCGDAGEPRIVGCYKQNEHGGCIIITRIPEHGDYSLLDTEIHEIAHCQGWIHPPWPGTS